MSTPAKLWISDDTRKRLQDLLRSGQETVLAIHTLSRQTADSDVPSYEESNSAEPGKTNVGGLYGESCAVAWLLSGEVAYARKAWDFLMMHQSHIEEAENLRLGRWAQLFALICDACRNGWNDSQQEQANFFLAHLAERLREVERFPGDPHIVTNNHWGVNHAGAALAAMAAHGGIRDGQHGTWDLGETIEWARQRARAFISQHGDWGLYHEGIGYQMYPASIWLPLVFASRNFDGTDLLAGMEYLQRMPLSLYAAVATRRQLNEETLERTDALGVKLSWNDDGSGFGGSCVDILAIALAEPRFRGALRRLFDRLHGIEGDRSFLPQFGGRFFTLLYYPYDVEAVEPEGILPRHITDARQGYSLFRNRYRDANDAIVGAYARVFSPGGHRHDDAGSVRVMALDHDWVMGGGQARSAATWQSVAVARGGERPKPPGCGAILWDTAEDHGGVFGMELRQVSRCYHERYVAVDYSRQSGSELALAILDQIDDHREHDWDWNLTTSPELEVKLEPDDAAFRLQAPDGANLYARFLGILPDELALDSVPASQRTFQSGGTVDYPGRPLIRATFKHRPFLGIYVVMTVQQGTAPAIDLLQGLDVLIGKHQWKRPFGAAIPARFRLGETGVLSKYPAGQRGYRAPTTADGFRDEPASY